MPVLSVLDTKGLASAEKPALLRTNEMFSKNPHCDLERQRGPESSGGQGDQTVHLARKGEALFLLVQLVGWAALPGPQDLQKRSYLSTTDG